MPVYEEIQKDKNGKPIIGKDGKPISKKIDGKKIYYIRTYITDENGEAKQITRHNKDWVGLTGQREAQQEENRLRNSETIQTIKKKKEIITIKMLRDLYLEFLKGKIDDDTLYSKKIKLGHFCDLDLTNQVNTFPNMNILNYDKTKYSDWQKQMKEKKYFKGKEEKKYSIKRLNSIHSEICRMLDFGITNGYCNINFAKQCGKIGTPKEIKLSYIGKKYETITYDEYQKLLLVSHDNLKYNVFFDLTFCRGVRIGEVRAFQVKDYLKEKKQLMVNHTMSKKNKLKEPKTASSKAPIDLDDYLCNKIEKLIATLQVENENNCEQYIFGGQKPISENALREATKKYFKLANITKHIRVHDFRHSCATWLCSIGMPITFISKILRHANINETMKTYTHLFDEDYFSCLKKLNNYKNQN